jgi:glycosyltransferase involved in cell wall biosynthesis
MNAELLAEADIGIGASGTDEWCDALSALLDDEQRRRDLGTAGRLLTERKYNVSAVADRSAIAIRSVLT